MSLEYNYYLVFLSVFAAMQAGFVGLALAQRISRSVALHRRALIAASAITLAVGIWSMHFIGLLAIVTTATIDYVVLPTLLSFLICILVVGVSIYMASLRSRLMLFFAALFMGGGIATMHYVGMLALNGSAVMHHNHFYIVGSIMLAILASGLTLWMAFLANKKYPVFLVAIIFGFAVSGMHYVAMAGMSLTFLDMPRVSSTFISSDILAIVLSVVAFAISALFMLTLIPKRKSVDDDDSEWGIRLSRQSELDENNSQINAGVIKRIVKEFAAPTVFIPIEKNGEPFQIAAKDIFSVHANAHYTFIFNGRDDLFCSLSISEVDEQLNSGVFFRTHRSYIINLQHLERIEKSGDAAIAELRCAIRRKVPVARARVTELRREWSDFKKNMKQATAK